MILSSTSSSSLSLSWRPELGQRRALTLLAFNLQFAQSSPAPLHTQQFVVVVVVGRPLRSAAGALVSPVSVRRRRRRSRLTNKKERDVQWKLLSIRLKPPLASRAPQWPARALTKRAKDATLQLILRRLPLILSRNYPLRQFRSGRGLNLAALTDVASEPELDWPGAARLAYGALHLAALLLLLLLLLPTVVALDGLNVLTAAHRVVFAPF